MSLAGHGPKSGSRHVCLIIAYTGQQGPVLYKGDKGVNVAAPPAEGDSAEAGGRSASSLPLLDSAHKRQSQQQINAVGLDDRDADRYNAVHTGYIVIPHDLEGVTDIRL